MTVTAAEKNTRPTSISVGSALVLEHERRVAARGDRVVAAEACTGAGRPGAARLPMKARITPRSSMP